MNRDFTGNMRPGQKNRGRGGRNNMGGGYNPNRQGGGGGGGGGRGPHRPQNFDSNGPSVKIRGNAYQVFERYIAMAREAASAGDRIAAENLYQHAEHYYRIMQANGEGQQNQRPMTPADNEMGAGPEDGQPQQPGQPNGQQQAQPNNNQQGQQQAQPHPAPAQNAPQPPAPPDDYLA